VGCRTTKPKQDLTRIVRTADGRVEFDTTGRARGRGAYVCADPKCARKALTVRTLYRALRTNVDGAALAELRAEADQLHCDGSRTHE
jgi:hypothetical protein